MRFRSVWFERFTACFCAKFLFRLPLHLNAERNLLLSILAKWDKMRNCKKAFQIIQGSISKSKGKEKEERRKKGKPEKTMIVRENLSFFRYFFFLFILFSLPSSERLKIFGKFCNCTDVFFFIQLQTSSRCLNFRFCWTSLRLIAIWA